MPNRTSREPAPRQEQEGVFTRERVLTVSLAILTGLVLYACYLLLKPFITPLAFALALGLATAGPYRWIRARVKNVTLAAAITVILVAVTILGPISFVLTYLVQQGVETIGQFRTGDGIAQVRRVIEQQPLIGSAVAWAHNNLNLEQQIGRVGEALAGQATNLLSGSIGVITQLVITLFVLFFLYRDAEDARDALRRLLPLSTDEANRMFRSVQDTIVATVNGSLTVAAVQALLAGIMYSILGVPGAVLWASITFITALVPVFGTFLVWAPIAAYLAITGSFVKALVLVGWGVLAVGTIDNLLYPFLVGDKLRLHTVPTFFAIMGGIAVFGPVGLILGPLVLAIAIGLLDIWWVRTAQGQAAETAISPVAESPVPPGTEIKQPPE
jgi:predicted PurR-regulated permease PerM